MKSLIKNKKFIICISAVLIIILIIGSILLFNRGNEKNETSVTKNITNNYVAYIKINPSTKLINKLKKIMMILIVKIQKLLTMN